MLTRPYDPADRAACLSIFDSNTPDYFAPAERAEFVADLRTMPATETPALVMVRAGKVIAFGSLTLAADGRCASLSWGMVHRAEHGQGIGTRLTQARLALARSLPGLSQLGLCTSQHTVGFYQRFGFTITARTPNGFGPGLDRVDMTLLLAPDAASS